MVIIDIHNITMHKHKNLSVTERNKFTIKTVQRERESKKPRNLKEPINL